jgi:excisionase family DNA binding protein
MLARSRSRAALGCRDTRGPALPRAEREVRNRSGLPADEGPAAVIAVRHLLTADQLAERWQVPKSHVYRLTREGLIPTVRLGRYYRYRPDAIERWEANAEQPHKLAAHAA